MPIKSLKIRALMLAFFASIAGVGLGVPAWLFSSNLLSVYLFSDFYYAVTALPFLGTLGDNAAFIIALLLIGILEVSMASGFTTAAKLETKRKQKAKTAENTKSPTGLRQSSNSVVSMNGTSANHINQPTIFSDQETEELVDEQGLKKDEQTLMELFLYGKVTQITPLVDPEKPEGYTFEGVPQLDWETKRFRQTLGSLVRKGYLKAELVDKVIVCMGCGSSNVRVKKLCPECMSMRLRKEGLIEHFSCGAVDRQTAFEAGNGDLVCPKCKAKLQLIGSDYRVLPPAYMCLGCNVRSSEPLLVVKCDNCGATAQLDEEPEVLLYKYTANSELPSQELQQIKPVEVCTNFFKSLGYTFVTPAFVSGKSGNQHLFDILILGRVGWIEPQNAAVTNSTLRKDNGNTVIEVLISSKLIDLEEMTRIYGMINDIDCDALIFVIPGMTENARNYAAAYNMKVSEGKTIEEALANSKIPKAGGMKA